MDQIKINLTGEPLAIAINRYCISIVELYSIAKESSIRDISDENSALDLVIKLLKQQEDEILNLIDKSKEGEKL